MARPIVLAAPDVVVVSREWIMEKIAENYLAFFSWNLPVCSNLFPGNEHFQIKFGMVADMVEQAM
jgi:hypothetical protein